MRDMQNRKHPPLANVLRLSSLAFLIVASFFFLSFFFFYTGGHFFLKSFADTERKKKKKKRGHTVETENKVVEGGGRLLECV